MAWRFYEFFAGGGMARLGLGPGWTCAFANDLDPMKAAAYRENFPPAEELVVGDVARLAPAQLPGRADLAWASFPCQDLSLAGERAGLAGARSGTFWPFWRLIERLAAEGRAPRLIVLENVCGALTSHGGRDFATLSEALAPLYRFGALVIDAALFVPQSRPRLFVAGLAADLAPPPGLLASGPDPAWHPPAVERALAQLAPTAAASWLWWRLPVPPRRNSRLADVIEEGGWRGVAETERLLALMSEANRAKLADALASGRTEFGALYRRTRMVEGARRQRAEVRFDGLAGCLRTPAGGSSRQSVLKAAGGEVRSRLLTSREAARLMGLPEEYRLPANYNAAYRLAGDGVAVPVVRHLATHLLGPILAAQDSRLAAAE